MCCVFDSAAQAFANPMFVPHANLALRSFQNEVNRADTANQLYHHPEDFTLYEIGTYDDASAAIEVIQPLRVIARAKDLQKQDD